MNWRENSRRAYYNCRQFGRGVNNSDVNFDEAKLPCEEKRHFPRINKEAMEIEKNKDHFNEDDTYSLANSWKSVRREKRKKKQKPNTNGVIDG
jgi:hypothetical protein